MGCRSGDIAHPRIMTPEVSRGAYCKISYSVADRTRWRSEHSCLAKGQLHAYRYSSVSVSAYSNLASIKAHQIQGASDSRIAFSAAITQPQCNAPQRNDSLSITITNLEHDRSYQLQSKYLSLTPHLPCIKIVQDQDLPHARSRWSFQASPLPPNCPRQSPPRLRPLPRAQQSTSLFASPSSTSSASSSSAPTEPFWMSSQSSAAEPKISSTGPSIISPSSSASTSSISPASPPIGIPANPATPR